MAKYVYAVDVVQEDENRQQDNEWITNQENCPSNSHWSFTSKYATATLYTSSVYYLNI